MGLDDYIKAGKIAGEVRENVRNTNWVGKQYTKFVNMLKERSKNEEPNVHFQ